MIILMILMGILIVYVMASYIVGGDPDEIEKPKYVLIGDQKFKHGVPDYNRIWELQQECYPELVEAGLIEAPKGPRKPGFPYGYSEEKKSGWAYELNCPKCGTHTGSTEKYHPCLGCGYQEPPVGKLSCIRCFREIENGNVCLTDEGSMCPKCSFAYEVYKDVPPPPSHNYIGKLYP